MQCSSGDCKVALCDCSPLMGGDLSAVRVQCDYLGISPYWKPTLCGTRGIIVV